MKKFLKITLLILVLVWLGYLTYRHYKKSAVLLNTVHVDAESVIKVGLHDIKKTLITDVLSSPKYYWDRTSSKKKKMKDNTDNDKGIDLMPYSAIFYTMPAINNTWFTTIEIEDIEDFENYITDYAKKKGSLIIDDNKDYKYVSLNKSKVVLAWNQEQIAVAITLESDLEQLYAVFEDVLIRSKLIKDIEHKLLHALRDKSDHIVISNTESIITFNFEDGLALIDGNMQTKTPDSFSSQVVFNEIPNASMQLHFDANFENEINKDAFVKWANGFSFFEKNNIDAKDFSAKTNGMFSLGIKGSTIQQDTIISYEYDDNFEKVAVKQEQEKAAPKITLDVGTKKSDSLNHYLEQQGAISNNVFTAIPYYTFYTAESDTNMIFSTTKTEGEKQESSSSNFFELRVDFESLNKDLSVPQADQVFKLLEGLNVYAQQIQGSNEIAVIGQLSGEKKDINILSQLYFGMKEK